MIELISVLLRIKAIGECPVEFNVNLSGLQYEIWEHFGYKSESRSKFLKNDKEAIQEISNLLNYLL